MGLLYRAIQLTDKNLTVRSLLRWLSVSCHPESNYRVDTSNTSECHGLHEMSVSRHRLGRCPVVQCENR